MPKCAVRPIESKQQACAVHVCLCCLLRAVPRAYVAKKLGVDPAVVHVVDVNENTPQAVFFCPIVTCLTHGVSLRSLLCHVHCTA